MALKGIFELLGGKFVECGFLSFSKHGILLNYLALCMLNLHVHVYFFFYPSSSLPEKLKKFTS